MQNDWLGELAPVGLLVSAPALDRAQVVVSRAAPGLVERQALLQGIWEANDRALTPTGWARIFEEVLEWRASDVESSADALSTLAVPLRAYQETLRPDFAVREGDTWLMLGAFAAPSPDAKDDALDSEPSVEEPGGSVGRQPGGLWHASPHARFERLPRENGVSIGLLCSPTAIRLVYAPKGEMSGYGTFHLRHLVEVPGRALLSAFIALLNADRLFVEPKPRRLPALLELSRRYQNEVSTRLAEQVLDALHELLRGFQAADALDSGTGGHGGLLRTLAREDPAHIQGGLVTVLMRLVFLLYAEEQGLLPKDPVFVRQYALGGLFERLRADHDRFPDTMDQRYGAYAWLLTLFRLVHDGGGRDDEAVRLRLPERLGHLFDPDRWPFLEGRPPGVLRVVDAGVPEPPRVSDGCLYRVLERLIYTASAGSEGTLGGLIEVGRSMHRHVAAALGRARLCSSDPVCAHHTPDNQYEARWLHGAACHACMLIAEPSCEQRNQFIDRALLVPTVERAGVAFFD